MREQVGAGAPLVAAVNITGPAFVNINSSFQIQTASAATGLSANGYILTSVLATGTVTVYTSGIITGLSGLTGGPAYLTLTGGAAQSTPVTGTGTYTQILGLALSSSSVSFNPQGMLGPQ